MPSRIHDLLVLGAGPAGLALAQSARAEGLDVAVMSPGPRQPWEQMLCAWQDELPTGTPTRHTWESARITLSDADTRLISRSYALLDNAALQTQLLPGLTVYDARAEQVEHLQDHSRIGAQKARLLIDATGHKPAVLHHPDTPPVGWQAAFGGTLHGPHGLPLDQAVFMDWRGHGPQGSASLRRPTFLYALPLGPERLFVEETSLIASTPPSMDTLQTRLRLRLKGLGLQGPLHDEERCLFPMGGALAHPQRVVPFGAAAGMVHPATGYSVGRSLGRSEAVAKQIADTLNAGLSPEESSQALWSFLWPGPARRGRALHQMGARILEGLDTHQTQAFFAAFFDMPVQTWSQYLDSESSPVWPMLKLFGSAAAPVRRQLLRSTLSQGVV